jgi:phosphatidylinositol-4,5-bisphosphate 4-phosphatase
MGMGIDSFRQVSSGWQEREIKLKGGGAGGVCQRSVSRQTLRVFDPKRPAAGVWAKVNIDITTFSFGINAIVVGWKQHFMDAWRDVREHHTRNMVKLVGDFGIGTFGAHGARPGDFVGEVYDRLETMRANPAASDADRTKAFDLLADCRGLDGLKS